MTHSRAAAADLICSQARLTATSRTSNWMARRGTDRCGDCGGRGRWTRICRRAPSEHEGPDRSGTLNAKALAPCAKVHVRLDRVGALLEAEADGLANARHRPGQHRLFDWSDLVAGDPSAPDDRLAVKRPPTARAVPSASSRRGDAAAVGRCRRPLGAP